jgi:chromate transporter
VNGPETQPAEAPPREGPGRLFLRFLRYGLLAWGGPVAQIARLKQELVERDRWVSPPRFNRALAVYQVLPGPEATELCVWFGTLAGGRLGGLAAGLAFVLPGLLLMLAAAWAYTTIGWHAPWVVGVMAGLKPPVAALILRAVHRLARHALRTPWLIATGCAAGAASAAGLYFAIILGTGAAAHTLAITGRRIAAGILLAALLAGAVVAWRPALVGMTTGAEPPRAAGEAHPGERPGAPVLFGSGLKAGLLTFGGAYTAIPFVRDDAVLRGGWLTEDQFMDGLAIGSVLPAPLVIFGTFVGFVAGGWAGALAITAGIFLPAFAFTLIGHRLFEALVERPAVHAALDGVAAAVIGLIAVTGVEVTLGAIQKPTHAVLLVLALVVLYAWRSAWAVPAVIVAGGVLGGLLLRG